MSSRLVMAMAKLKSMAAQVGDFLDPFFPKQTEFITDGNRRKALWCTRRAAKSYTAGLALSQTAQLFPETNCLYLGLTRGSAKGIIWKDILKVIDRKHQLNMKFNESELTCTAPNGSMIYVTGVDAEADEMQKLLGKKWKLVVIDEAQSYSVDLRALVYGVLGPAIIDQGGTICLMGTAGNVTQGLFYDITLGIEAGWKLFEWTAYDNPYVAKQWHEEIEDIKLNRPAFMLTTLFKQWYLNQWCIDETARVYKYSEKNNSECLPSDIGDWSYVLGLDLAHSPDSTAFVVGAYSAASPRLYLLFADKHLGMDISSVAAYIKKLETRYNFEVKVCDGANKQAVAELNNRHNLNLIAADKVAKVDHILLMNDDFIQGHIQCLPQTAKLKEEYTKLVWCTDASGNVKEPRKENPNIHNDLADASYYLWRYCYQYLYHAPTGFKDKAKLEVWEPEHISKLQERARKIANPNELDLEWDEAWNEKEL